jgi:hypothetical protein
MQIRVTKFLIFTSFNNAGEEETLSGMHSVEEPRSVWERGSHLHWNIFFLILILRICAASFKHRFMRIYGKLCSFEDTLKNVISYLERTIALFEYQWDFVSCCSCSLIKVSSPAYIDVDEEFWAMDCSLKHKICRENEIEASLLQHLTKQVSTWAESRKPDKCCFSNARLVISHKARSTPHFLPWIFIWNVFGLSWKDARFGHGLGKVFIDFFQILITRSYWGLSEKLPPIPISIVTEGPINWSANYYFIHYNRRFESSVTLSKSLRIVAIASFNDIRNRESNKIYERKIKLEAFFIISESVSAWANKDSRRKSKLEITGKV